MRFERRFLQWGLFFIALGAVPLLVELGWLDRTAVSDAWRLWPLFLIAVGLGILLARSRFHFVGGLISSITFGLIIGGALAGGIGSIGCPASSAGGTAFPSQTGTFGSSASVDLTIDCGTTTLTTAAGSGWSLSGSGDPNRPPAIDAGPDRLSIGTSHGGGLFEFGAAQPHWTIQLPTDPTLDLSLTMNAGSVRMGLAGARLGSVSVTGNAGSVRVDLAQAGAIRELDATVNAGDIVVALPAASMNGSVTVNAGHFGFCLPPGTAIRVETGGALSSNNFASRGLVQNGTTWTGSDFATAVTRIDLQVTANAGSVELNPDGGCQ